MDYRLILIFLFLPLVAPGAPNFEDDVYPLFKKHCLNCHNPDKKKADLDLSTLPGIQVGSSGGPVVKAGSPDSSVLFMVMNHHEDFEAMPPKKPKLPQKELQTVHQWIAGGLIASKGGKTQLRKVQFDLSHGSGARPKNPAQPTNLPKVIAASPRFAAPVTALAASPWVDLIAMNGHEQIHLFAKSGPSRDSETFEPVRNADLIVRKGYPQSISIKKGKGELIPELSGDFLEKHRQFTISMWLKPNPEMKSPAFFGRESFYLFLEPSKTGWNIRATNRDAQNGIVYTGRVDGIGKDSWQHVTVVFTGSRWGFYYNGVPVAHHDVPENQPGFLLKPGPFYIGGNGSVHQDREYRGAIEDFRVYQDALTDKEVAAIFQNSHDSFTRIGILPFPEGTIHDLRFSRSGELLVAAGGTGVDTGKVVIFDVKTGKREAEIGDETDIILSADLSPDHQYVVIGTPLKMAKVYSAKDGSLLHKIEKHTDWVNVVRFSPDGNWFASGDRNGGLHVWETKTGNIVYTLDEHRSSITALSWRSDGAILASAAEDGKFVLWDMKDGWATRTARGHIETSPSRYTKGTGILDIQFTKSGQLITAGRDLSLKLWNTDGSELRKFSALESLPTRIAGSWDGSYFCSGDFSGNLHIWKTDSADPIQTISPNPGEP